MMKYLLGVLLFVCVSCGKREDILLPKANKTIVKEVVDLSPIYIFFRVKDRDTLAEVNRNNSISTTNWVFNIDKRLPLRLVIPEVMKLQKKKREAKEHQNELAQNYYSYADTIGKNLAFVPFTNVHYKLEKPKNGVVVFFAKNGKIIINNTLVSKEDLLKNINNFNEKGEKIRYYFDKDSSYGSYVQAKVFLETILKRKSAVEEEFIY